MPSGYFFRGIQFCFSNLNIVEVTRGLATCGHFNIEPGAEIMDLLCGEYLHINSSRSAWEGLNLSLNLRVSMYIYFFSFFFLNNFIV